MDEFFSPDDVRNFMNRSTTDRQRLILFLIYNYGITVPEMIQITSAQFMVKREFIIFKFIRESTKKEHHYKIQFENYRLFYRVLKDLQDHEALLHKDKNQSVSEALIKNDLFDVAVTMNQKITAGSLFDSHLFWLFRKGVSFPQAVAEYGISMSGKPYKIWEKAMLAGMQWPYLLEP
ncbi:hypothetical protein [Prolixibacter sp. SD074]|jgi:site-specific recombinase XerD|uniref:hypothetical protein n=1 Tax=Prolixibacter sp. SD074 TaxID=2652391 RepID=UPI00126E71A7|nr:hypothetical protein [Prolixibacter sp. SD074]GET29489.1 hypothetical protein SD074_16910 [Prolixibacter sp. SD074]